jgi:hypothetical protein
MRGDSVASLKGKSRLQPLPQQGTRIRKVYDALLEHAGHPVQLTATEAECIPPLRDIYCCDITPTGHHTYVLVGEWDDKVYIDYVKQRFEKGT